MTEQANDLASTDQSSADQVPTDQEVPGESAADESMAAGTAAGAAAADRPAGATAGRPGARRRVRGLLAEDVGMATAEYAIATIAAAGFAGLLVVILRSDEVRGLLTGLVRTALSM